MTTIHVTDKQWETLRTLLKIPHKHYDGMNECSICDEEILSAAVREIVRLRESGHAARYEFDAKKHAEVIAETTLEMLDVSAYKSTFARLIQYIETELTQYHIRNGHRDITRPCALCGKECHEEFALEDSIWFDVLGIRTSAIAHIRCVNERMRQRLQRELRVDDFKKCPGNAPILWALAETP